MLVWPSRYAVESAAVCEAIMEPDPGQQLTGPSGTLAERVGDHVAAANQVIQASHKVIAASTVQVQQARARVGRSYQLVGDTAGRAQAAHLSATAAGQRFLRAKQRELAAHARALRRHDEAAELQERFGHPDRAANARAHAQHTRELRDQALEELRDWEGPTPTGEAHPAPTPS